MPKRKRHSWLDAIGVKSRPKRSCSQKNEAKRMKVVVLVPFILLVWLGAKLDPHLFRHWDVHSLRFWQQTKCDWKAWAIAMIGWVSLGCAVGAIFLVARQWA